MCELVGAGGQIGRVPGWSPREPSTSGRTERAGGERGNSTHMVNKGATMTSPQTDKERTMAKGLRSETL